MLSATADMEMEISNVSYDSRVTRPGDLFVAMRGFETDGHAYIGRAAAADSARTLFRNSRLENSLESIFQLFVSVMIGFFSLSYR